MNMKQQSILIHLALGDIGEQDKDQYEEIEGSSGKKAKKLRLALKSDGEEEIGNTVVRYPVHITRKSMAAMSPIELKDNLLNKESMPVELFGPLSVRLGYTNQSESLFPVVTAEGELPRKVMRHAKKEKSQDFRMTIPISKGEMGEEYERLKTERVRTRNSEIEGIKSWSRQNLNLLSPEQRQKAIIRNAINVRFLYEH
jgi:hypothetical protein